MLSRQVDAEDALRIGLVHRVVDDDRLVDEVRSLAEELANGPTPALAGIKRNLAAANGDVLRQALQVEAENFVACRTQDHQQAMQAVLAKRRAVF